MRRLYCLSFVAVFSAAACSDPIAPTARLALPSLPSPSSPAVSAGCAEDDVLPGRVHCLASAPADGGTPSVEWDMGDGNRADGISLSYVYGDPGAYTIRVRARAANAATEWRTVATLDVGDARLVSGRRAH